MFLFLLLLFTVMFLLGVAVSLIRMAKYTTYAETEGVVLDFLKCNPDENEQQPGRAKAKESAVVISYTVEGKTYHLATNMKRQKNENTVMPVKVLYDPYFPGNSLLRESFPLLGRSLMLVSVICFILLIYFY